MKDKITRIEITQRIAKIKLEFDTKTAILRKIESELNESTPLDKE